MKRRNFLVGAGAASVGGSALLGSGAFSRVESDRAVTIAVAEDSDAYLGLDKCDTPNGSYVHDDGKGHIKIRMDDSNPDHKYGDLGAGINSNSTSIFHRVFQICNQGKEQACVWIYDDDKWPTLEEGDHAGERQVDFYIESYDDESIIGEDNAVLLDVGDCVCVGIKVLSYELSEEDTALEDLDDQITIVADVDGDCTTGPQDDCPIYGITQGEGTAEIQSIAVPQSYLGTTIAPLVYDGDPIDDGEEYWPNGLAFDTAEGVWYVAATGGNLYSFDGAEIKSYDGDLGAEVAGAAWYMNGGYYYIPQNTTLMKRAEIAGGSFTTHEIGDLADVNEEIETIGLGDVAIDRESDPLTVYVSTSSSENSARFIEVEMDEDGEEIEAATVLADDDDENVDIGSHAVNKQIAFGPANELYAHQSGSPTAYDGNWYTVDLDDGSLNQDAEEPLATTDMLTDLAQCGFPGE